jgi:hypothetical protein
MSDEIISQAEIREEQTEDGNNLCCVRNMAATGLYPSDEEFTCPDCDSHWEAMWVKC